MNCKAQTFARAFSIPHFEQLSQQTKNTAQSPNAALVWTPSIFLQIKLEKRKQALSEVWILHRFSRDLHGKLGVRETEEIKDTEPENKNGVPRAAGCFLEINRRN